jgi:hypothetical protein
MTFILLIPHKIWFCFQSVNKPLHFKHKSLKVEVYSWAVLGVLCLRCKCICKGLIILRLCVYVCNVHDFDCVCVPYSSMTNNHKFEEKKCCAMLEGFSCGCVCDLKINMKRISDF